MRGLRPERLTALLAQLTDLEAYDLLHDWRFFARPEQLAPPGDWLVWTYLAGRGSGKTRSGAEWVRERLKAGAKHVGLIAPTTADARKVMVEGISGLLAVCSPHDRTNDGELLGRPEYEPSNRAVVWANGAIATTYSAEEPNRLRGPQHDTIWCDELAAWEAAQETWDMAMFGLRVGSDPRAMVTTTPKPLPIVRELVRDKRNVFTKGTTWDNRANLADTFFRHVVDKYQGTRLGRQELSGEILEESEGALWTRDLIHQNQLPPPYLRIVVGVDPATTSKDESALTGIVVAALGVDRRGYILADYSGQMTPGQWGEKVIQAYDDWKADRIIAEGNQGGDMVRFTIATVRENAPVTVIHASQSKQARAEPVAALYEQKKVDHVGSFPELEDQMCTWEPLSGMASPDRLDAMVWAMTDLMVSGVSKVFDTIEQDIVVAEPIKIPGLWPRVCAVCVDRARFAAVWGAWDKQGDTIYLYDEISVSRGDVAVHAEALRRRGGWIPTIIDLEGNGRSKDEGVTLVNRMLDLNVEIFDGKLDLNAGLDQLIGRLTTGRLRVFSQLTNWMTEYRRYQRDEKHEIVEGQDHLMQATALLATSGLMVSITENRANSDAEGYDDSDSTRNPITGY